MTLFVSDQYQDNQDTSILRIIAKTKCKQMNHYAIQARNDAFG